MLRYKLVTLPKDVIGIPVISVSPSSIAFTSLKQSITVTPATLNLAGGNSALGYTVVLSDDTVATLSVAPDGAVNSSAGTTTDVNTISSTSFIDDETTAVTTAGKTVVRVGSKFILTAKPQASTTQIKRALLTIIGNETGGFKTISITVDPAGFLVQDIGINTSPLSAV